MSLPLLFESDLWWYEYLLLGLAVITFSLTSLIRRWRWNRDGLYRIYSGRWIIYLLLLLVLYVASVFAARGATLLWPVVKPVYETNVLILWVDISKSVLARDIELAGKDEGEPRRVSRLTLIKQEITNLLPYLIGNQVFLGVFGDEAHPVFPLTLMTEETAAGFREELFNITERRVAQADHGTDVGRALIVAADQIPPELTSEGKENCVPHLLVLLTDGEPVGDQNILAPNLELGLFRLSRIPCLFIKLVGVGNPEKLSPIPVLDNLGRPTGEYEADEKGIILTKPNFQYLRGIAAKLGGDFLDGRSGKELERALVQILTKDRRVIGHAREIKRVPLAWYLAWFILGLLFLLNPIRNFLA